MKDPDSAIVHLAPGLLLLFESQVVYASNFGDLPRVLPVFWLALVISFFVALAKAMKPIENSRKKTFRLISYLVYQALGIVLSCVLIIILWMTTL